MSQEAKEIARHIREAHFGNNWCDNFLKQELANMTWQQAVAKPIPQAHSIAELVFHLNFYLNYVHRNLKNDFFHFEQEDTYNMPPLTSEEDWQQLLQKTWDDAESFAQTIENIPAHQLYEAIPPRHNSFYKNLHGIVEHTHYHLGQIILLKKLLN